jgi:uncharacterized membrane protein
MRYERARNAALLIGVGLGGFLDGIVLHQIAHWHQMLSSTLPPTTVEAMQRNMAADGWFHLVMWAVTFAGILVLWGAIRGPGPLPSTRTLLGYMVIGWGAFNIVEGIIDHHLLELHHVRDLPTHMEAYDWIFLALSLGLVLVGLAMRDGKGRVPASAIERRTGRDRRGEIGFG